MIWFRAELYWPSPTTMIVRMMRGNEVVTGAAEDDPWCAAARCVGYARYRLAHTAGGGGET